MAGPDDGWETISDPSDVPSEIRKSLGVAGVRAALGLSTGTGGAGKAIPEWADKKYSPKIETYSALRRAADTFQDDFAGFGAGVENTIQGYTGLGTEGQRDWWAQFRSADNQVRNQLFGAALTATEQRAYESTTITPSMSPSEIRRNLRSRSEIVQAALKRTTRFLKAQGYNPEAIEALAGEYAPDLGLAREQQEGGDPASTAAGAADGSGSPPPSPGPDEQGPLVAGDVANASQVANPIELTGAQKAAFAALARRGGTADELGALLGTFGVTPANPSELAQLVEALKKNPDLAFTVRNDNTVKPVDPGDGGLGAAVRGIGNAATFGFMDEIGAVADAIGTGGTYADNLNRRRGLELYDEQNSPVARVIGQLGGGAVVGGALTFANAGQAARAAAIAALRGGATRAQAQAAGRQAFAIRTAAEAAAQGGVYGAGESEGGLAERAGGAAVGAAVGGIGGAALSYGGGRLLQAVDARRAARAAAPLAPQQEALAAAERQNIVPFPADVAGGATRRATSVVAQTIGGNQQIVTGARATVDSAQAVRDRVAAGIGTALPNEAAGETAAAGARAFIARTGQRIGRIYEAAGNMAGRAQVDTPEARRVLDAELGPLEESPIQGPGVAILRDLRDALVQPMSVRGLREARTQLRDRFEAAGLRRSNIERVASRVIDAATDDLISGLRAQGLDRAATAYQRADRLWRERVETIDEFLDPIITNKSGEEVMAGLTRAMAGNNRRFVGFINALPANEQATVRASLIQAMGRATKGAQDETGEAFSLGTFLTHWNGIGETAKQRLFGPEGRAALNDLATYAAQSKEAQRYANTSNSGGAAINWWTAASGAGAWGTMGATILAENVTGRLLASPRFARWLARAPRAVTPEQREREVARLSRIARSEPAIANDILGLQARLADAFGGAPARLAAEEGRGSAAVADRQRGQQQRPAGELRP
jgi:hypothetical protein